MRCPDCNKFVSYDTDNEPKIISEDLSEDGFIEIDASITLSCAE